MFTIAGILLILAGVAAFFSNGSIALTTKKDGVQKSHFDTGRIAYKIAGVLSALYGVYIVIISII